MQINALNGHKMVTKWQAYIREIIFGTYNGETLRGANSDIIRDTNCSSEGAYARRVD